jgi:hypothetical protein
MGISWCCVCDKKATRSVNGKYYCGICEVVEEEKPKKKGFWAKLGDLLDRSGCNCDHHYWGGF